MSKFPDNNTGNRYKYYRQNLRYMQLHQPRIKVSENWQKSRKEVARLFFSGFTSNRYKPKSRYVQILVTSALPHMHAFRPRQSSVHGIASTARSHYPTSPDRNWLACRKQTVNVTETSQGVRLLNVWYL